ncbi:3-hydroxyacyl-CoA dehydrogenase NAD-binding domain-containing protein [Streptomyces sp. NBC_00237]|uniref:3-hydroxyacyl-CoA dehydrogenase NAD-binding domain-containing protein n=1 Tax=Streptomyces sp. NBC_00237 TaxID=2975687 RepID=UPI00224DF214|nr:3-hydroxyacyl-CoA dehydrogenase NAD-binding domain-containing protein [Streptomyces sp. NBC_00237]MCX5205877.1 3-hydroxyacyl-CoA dehydrogenase NAD-binding domain-containing protein [Streptomyces sp. NBC_00237]
MTEQASWARVQDAPAAGPAGAVAPLPVRQLVAVGGRDPVLEGVLRRPPGRGEIRLRTEWSLVSPGTELHYLDRSARTGERFVLGYCAAGVVDAVGPLAPGFAPGDRVIAMGWGEAVHSEAVTVPYRLCRRVPDGTDLADAVVAGLAATAVHAVDRAVLAPADEVAVVGAGMVGQLVAQTAAARGNPVTLLDLRPERLRTAPALGLAAADGTHFEVDREAAAPGPAGNGGRCVFLCGTGDAGATVVAAARWAGRAPGRPRLVGVGRFAAHIDFSVELGNLDIRYAARCGAGYRDASYARGLTDAVAPEGEGTVTENLQRALDLIRTGKIRPVAMDLPRFGVEQAAEAYAQLRERPAHPAVLFSHGPADGPERGATP